MEICLHPINGCELKSIMEVLLFVFLCDPPKLISSKLSQLLRRHTPRAAIGPLPVLIYETPIVGLMWQLVHSAFRGSQHGFNDGREKDANIEWFHQLKPLFNRNIQRIKTRHPSSSFDIIIFHLF
jgi:hypothetical protein